MITEDQCLLLGDAIIRGSTGLGRAYIPIDVQYEAIEIIKRSVFNNGWTPVSERMPEKGTDVLVCYREDEVTEFFVAKYVDILFGRDTKMGERWTLPQYYKNSCVVAWMPLPKAYEEEK